MKLKIFNYFNKYFINWIFHIKEVQIYRYQFKVIKTCDVTAISCVAVRNHVVHVSESSLITIAGGKWTTYRAMAEETVDTALKVRVKCSLRAYGSI